MNRDETQIDAIITATLQLRLNEEGLCDLHDVDAELITSFIRLELVKMGFDIRRIRRPQ